MKETATVDQSQLEIMWVLAPITLSLLHGHFRTLAGWTAHPAAARKQSRGEEREVLGGPRENFCAVCEMVGND